MKDDDDRGVVSQASVVHTLTEDVRQQLYGVLKRQGMIDKMKSEMRHRLVMELTSKRAMPPPAPSGPGRSLSQRAADSLVADYLSRRHFEYSLSVFIPEAGLSGQKLLSSGELLDLLHINPHSKFHKQLSHTLNADADGFLWSFLRQLSERAVSGRMEAAAQTDVRSGPMVPLSERLSRIERHYDEARSAEAAAGQTMFEERLMNYQRETEARMRREMTAELERVKATEIAKMRLEERERLHIDWEAKRREMEAQHREKMQAAVERERAAGEHWKRQQEQWDREAHARRQALLEEVDTVRHRETAVRREQEAWQRERRLFEEKKKSVDDGLREREFRLREKEAEFDSRLENEREKIRLTEEKRFMERWRELEAMEVRALEEMRLAETEKETVRRMREEVGVRQAQFDEMEVIDYPTVKQENSALRQEIESLKERLTELRQDYDNEKEKLEALHRERSGPSREEVELRREMERAHESARQERAMAEHAMQGVQKRLQEEMTQHQQLLQRYEEQSLQLKEMNQEVEDLRQQLQHTEQALTNELYRRPRPSGVTPRTPRTLAGAGGDLTARSLMSVPDEAPFSARSLRRPPALGLGADPVLDLLDRDEEEVDDLVAETKWRLRALDQETEDLQTAYRSFQHRLSNPVYGGGHVPAATTYPKSALDAGSNLTEPLSMPPLNRIEPNVPGGTPMQRASEFANSPWAVSTATLDLDSGRMASSKMATVEPHAVTSARVRFADGGPARDLLAPRDRPWQQQQRPPGTRPEGDVAPLAAGEGSGPGFGASRHHLDLLAGREPRGYSSGLVTFDMPPDGDRSGPPSISGRADALANTSHDAGSTGEQLGPVASGPEAASTTAQSLEEEEEAEWEARRRRREEERALREQEEWEQQQRELTRLRGPQTSTNGSHPDSEPAPQEARKEEKEEQEKEKREEEEAGIDPVMQKYMAMVQQQRSAGSQPAPAPTHEPPASRPGAALRLDSEEDTGGISEGGLNSDRSRPGRDDDSHSDSFW